MIKSRETTEPASCLNKAEDDEPIFVLRAKDPLGAEIVSMWAARADGIHEDAKRDEALRLAAQMQQWRTDYLASRELPQEYGFKLIAFDGTEHIDMLRFSSKEDAEDIAKRAVHPKPKEPQHVETTKHQKPPESPKPTLTPKERKARRRRLERLLSR